MGGRGASAKGSASGGGSRSEAERDLAGYRDSVTVAGVLFDAFASSLEGGVGGGGRRRDDEEEEDE